jgi:hypothetical protein
MKTTERILTRIPVDQLWDDSGDLLAKRIRDLTKTAVRDLLTQGPVRFVIADVGKSLTWMAIDQRYEFWKRDVQPRLSDGGRIHLEQYPDGLAYTASERRLADDEIPIVLLEMRH